MIYGTLLIVTIYESGTYLFLWIKIHVLLITLIASYREFYVQPSDKFPEWLSRLRRRVANRKVRGSNPVGGSVMKVTSDCGR